MKKTALRFAVAVVLLGAVVASGVTINPNFKVEFTTCASGGSSSQTVTQGYYTFAVLKEDTTVCYAATCATGGSEYPAGTAIGLTMPKDTVVSCRSTGGTGKLVFTGATP
jgi:hypothetical protein